MYIRVRKTKLDPWEKIEINFLDFFVFNFVAGVVLGTIIGVIIATVTVFI